jgi:hypothetical protein
MSKASPLLPAEIGPRKSQDRLRPRWVAVIALISIFLGGLPLLGFLLCLYQWATGANPLAPPEDLPAYAKVVWVVSGVYGLVLFVLLFVGGVGLASCRPWGRTLHLVVGWVSVVVCLLGVGLWFLYYPLGGYRDPQYADHTWKWLSAWAACMWYPVFLVIWFSRARIRDEVKRW